MGRAAFVALPLKVTIMRNSRPHATTDDHGAIAIEFVFVVPFLIALIFTIAQFGIFFSMKVETESKARDAARTLALGGPAAVVATPAGWTATGVVKCAAGDTAGDATVTFSHPYAFSIPFIPLGTKTITATGRMRCGG